MYEKDKRHYSRSCIVQLDMFSHGFSIVRTRQTRKSYLSPQWLRLLFPLGYVVVYSSLVFAPIVCVFLSGSCCVVQYFASFLVLRSSGLSLVALLLLRRCYRSLTLPHSTMGWSVICDSDIFWSY